MLKLRKEAYNICKKRFYSVQATTEDTKRKTSYTETIFLPKSSFPHYYSPKKIVERDQRIQQEAGFLEYYSWQRENLTGEEFVLHDGPPYANGKLHLGHALNKVTKDIILRSKLLQGRRVHYVPGWDCHGLPIETIALKNVENNLNPVEIRQKARKVAETMSEAQKEGFKQWGIIGDWEKQCYYTYDTNYVINQLQIFWKLFEKGLIYYDKKPTYWSPSSMTALAEAELLYVKCKSNAVVLRLESIQDMFSEPLYFLIWTTTPWTVPLNTAIFFSNSLHYSVVSISSFSGLYILATDLIKELEQKLKKEITVKSSISQEELQKLKYRHPWNKNKILNAYETKKISLKGTGILHVVPGHGHEDFLLGLEKKLEIKCSVDEFGRYTADAGTDLVGLDVLKEGSAFVTERLASDILLKEKYAHEYPHDWRTNQPIIIRTSNQWFIDSDQLKEKALESLKEVNVPLEFFKKKLQSRPYWCLSRQRSWGIPIPVFFHKDSRRPLLSKELVDHLCHLIETQGQDVWWTAKTETLFPPKICRELFVRLEDVVRGKDIMDIWFDSGVTWSYALDGKLSELYLEGVDQYTGWFQSSLLTSVALKNRAPFKKILTHGFAVDSKGKKMSKSLGNVIDPETVVKGENAMGVDPLRWWVASHFHHSNPIPASFPILQSALNCVKKLRLSFRFMLGALTDVPLESLEKYEELGHLDRYMLNCCYNVYHSVFESYNSYNFQKATFHIIFFNTHDISNRYLSAIKDKLYSDRDSSRRRACLYTLNAVLETLCHVVAPILPHLAEEVYSFHPRYAGRQKFFYRNSTWTPPTSWKDDSEDEVMKLVDEIRAEIYQNKNLSMFSCLIEVDEKSFELLKKFQNGMEESNDSELTSLLQVAEVKLKKGSRNISLTPSSCYCCPRCWRYTATESDQLCQRCKYVLVSH